MKISQLFDYLFKDHPADEPGKRAPAVIAIIAASLATAGPFIEAGFNLFTILAVSTSLLVFSWALYQVLHARYRYAAIVPLTGTVFMVFFTVHTGTGSHSPLWYGAIGAVLLLFLFLDNDFLALWLSLVPFCAFMIVGLAEINGVIPNPEHTNFFYIANVVATYFTITVLIFYIFRRQRILLALAHQSQQDEEKANTALRELNLNLENHVADRIRDLQIAAEVSREATRVLKLEELLPHLVEKTGSGFGLYFVAVYIYESEKRNLTLAASSGADGQKMQGLLCDIDAAGSPVAKAGRERQPIVLAEASRSPDDRPNHLLPETRAEAAIPMIVQAELIGVLDLQSNDPNSFSAENVLIMTTLAEQIGVAIQNARLYQEQVQMAAELRKVDDMKMQFLSSMSHELRTPLNAIINFVDMVAMGLVGPVTEKQKELLGNSLQSSRHLLHLINDVLDISKIQAGRLTLFIEASVNLYPEIEAVVDATNNLLKNKPVQLVLDIDGDLPGVSCDRRRLRQILLNLLTNAAKFTPQGSITLSAKRRPDSVIFAVIDTGPGISAEAQEIIFEPFVQTASGIKQVEGTGLGLPISRSLAQAHGGRLWVESQPGEGAAFYFSLPLVQPSQNN